MWAELLWRNKRLSVKVRKANYDGEGYNQGGKGA